jgi:hypothetical protein
VEKEVQRNFQANTSFLPANGSELAQATLEDDELQRVIHHIKNGWPNTKIDASLLPYFHRKLDLSIINNCVVNGERIIIPKNLRTQMLCQLHKGHPGIQRMKALARSYVYWPGIDTEIEQFVRQCQQCGETSKAPTKTLLQSWPRVMKPWTRVHVDFAGPMEGAWYLIMVDAFSKWPEVVQTRSITSQTTINLMRQIFARYGPPETLVTDNGTQFTSVQFATFCEEWGITHLRSPAYHPQSNGQAERFVDTLKRGLLKQKGEDVEKALQEVLYTYRYTPGDTVSEGKSPAEAFLGRKIRTYFSQLTPVQTVDEQRARDHTMEAQYNHHHGAKWREYKTGETVWVKNQPNTPLKQGTITGRHGRVIYDVQVENLCLRRHANQLYSRTNAKSDSGTKPPEKPDLPSNEQTPNQRPSRIKKLPLRYRDK